MAATSQPLCPKLEFLYTTGEMVLTIEQPQEDQLPETPARAASSASQLVLGKSNNETT